MNSTVLTPEQTSFDIEIDVVVVGGGGCGLTAALSAQQVGAGVLVLEQDDATSGTTEMSTGLIPAAGSRLQREAGVEDSPELFARDILEKNHHQTDEAVVRALAEASAATVDWLVDMGIELSLVDSFLYPGHSVNRMHGMPNRSGSELMGALCRSVEQSGASILTGARVSTLFVGADKKIQGVRYERPDGTTEDVGCRALILACCGFAGNSELVAEHIPEIADAVFFGHPGNRGDALNWGRMLGAAIEDIHSYQGHGGLAAGYGIPILWPLIMEGGIQVNHHGERFSNESRSYSEQAVDVVAQPGHFAYSVYDQRLHELMQEFDDYRDAMGANAIKSADSVAELATILRLPKEKLERTLTEVAHHTRNGKPDRFGRCFAARPELAPPYHGVKVNGALFHTQGGLKVDGHGQVLSEDGSLFPNLFAGGGAARGISGPSCRGYLAGNGLLTATTFGRLAGLKAAALVRDAASPCVPINYRSQ